MTPQTKTPNLKTDRTTVHEILGDKLVTRLVSRRGLGIRKRLYWLTRTWDGESEPFEMLGLTAEEALRYAIEMDKFNESTGAR